MVRIMYDGKIKIDESIGGHGTEKYLAVVISILIVSILLTVIISLKLGLFHSMDVLKHLSN